MLRELLGHVDERGFVVAVVIVGGEMGVGEIRYGRVGVGVLDDGPGRPSEELSESSLQICGYVVVENADGSLRRSGAPSPPR